MKRKNLPKSLRDKVWNHYIGIEKGLGGCFCCEKQIDSKNFEAGHVISVANGGEDKLENLRPVCSTCNKSMGTKNLLKFKEEYFSPMKEVIKKPKSKKDKIEREFVIIEKRKKPGPKTRPKRRCNHTLVRGKNKGKKCSKHAVKGSKYCSRHKKAHETHWFRCLIS